MIKNNFNELMAQRKLKITRVSNDTGISRPTLTALTRDDGKGIQFDTLNTLCNYFNVTPCEFFSYIPYDITYNFEVIDEKGKCIKEQGFESVYQKKALLFINIYNNKGNKINTFEILYLVDTYHNAVVDIDSDENGNEKYVYGNTSRIYLDSEQFRIIPNEFLVFIRNLDVQWQTKIFDDILYYFAKGNIFEKIDGDYIQYLETDFNIYL